MIRRPPRSPLFPYPPLSRPHIILEQQVSIDAAAAMHRRLAGICEPLMPETFLALDDATLRRCGFSRQKMDYARRLSQARSEEHTSELQSQSNLVCRLLLGKK